MKLMVRFLAILFFVVVLAACGNDDNGITTVPPQSLTETLEEDEANIQAYMQTHFYNYEDFENPPEGFDYRIIIDTIEGVNADKRPLSAEDFLTEQIEVSASDFGISDGEEDIPHTLRYLIIEQGEGDSVARQDSTYIRYEGSTLDRDLFDSAIGSPRWLDLEGNLITGAVVGFQEGLIKFQEGGEQVVENGDGTFSVQGSGMGIIIMPSGLGYFLDAVPGESYAPLVFTVNVLRTKKIDHDGDGILSEDEDLNGDGEVTDDDTDDDGFPNYVDSNDDGDGVSTNTEITDANGNIIFPYPDSDNDGTPDYLDPDIEWDVREE